MKKEIKDVLRDAMVISMAGCELNVSPSAKESSCQVTTPEQRMTSLEIAQLAGKRHSDVMRAIRKMEAAWENVCGRNFSSTSRIVEMPNGGTREVPCYSLTKSECLYVATKFQDEARARLVLRWEELELAERQRWMAEHAASGMPTINLRGSTGAQVVLVVGQGGVPARLLEWRPYRGPVRRLLARTVHGIVREGTDDYTLYVRISKSIPEKVDVAPQEIFRSEVEHLLALLD